MATVANDVSKECVMGLRSVIRVKVEHGERCSEGRYQGCLRVAEGRGERVLFGKAEFNWWFPRIGH